jgi:hypothetical protein
MITPTTGGTLTNLTVKASDTATAFSELLLNIDVPPNEKAMFSSPTSISSGATKSLSANGENFIILIKAQNNEVFNSLSFTTTDRSRPFISERPLALSSLASI